MKIAHVVRRYGPVGGMEKYVWELTRELAALGHEILVVCERKMCEDFPGIEVCETGAIRPRPRWLSLLRFSRRVERFFESFPEKNHLIHSHERLGIHAITTFHGPPFATIREKPWWRRISLRVQMQLFLERRELLSPAVKKVVPNSPLILSLLERYYPDAKFSEPVPPGVDKVKPRERLGAPANGGTIGFVGKEWKRKGLPFALEIADRLRMKRPDLKMLIAGPEPDEIRSLLASRNAYCECLGWAKDTSHFSRMDLLLHPARSEPYGMAIAEALSARVPVVISDQCGIAPYLSSDSGEVLSLGQDPESWVAACEAQLSRTSPPEPFERTWKEVAKAYEALYVEMKRS